MIAYFLFIILAALIESTVSTLPLSFLLIFFLAVSLRENSIFPLAFLSGLLLDFLSFRLIGLSSLYFVSFSFLVLLYQRKFEIDTPYFVLFFSFFGSLFYLWIQGSSYGFMQALISSIFTFFSYQAYKIFSAKRAY
jgi:cell shape-determining protein MreD